MIQLSRFLLASLIATLLSAEALAHPSHTSFAEMEWSTDGARLEVALRVIPEDVEEVLQLQQGRFVTLMNSPAVRNMLALWLADEFRVYAGGEAMGVEVLGLEVDYRACWIFFTVSAPRDRALSLQNRILIEHNSARDRVQINTLRRHWESASDRMTFTDEQPQPLWSPAAEATAPR